MTGVGGASSATTAASAQHAQAASALQMLQALSSLDSASSISSASSVGLSQSSASISGLGQLFGNLNQLATQNVSQFQQMASVVASDLLNAAQNQTGSTSTMLTNLANTIEQAATSGNALQLFQHHNRAQETQGYNSTGQPTSIGAANSTGSSTNASLNQLFVALAQQVGSALSI